MAYARPQMRTVAGPPVQYRARRTEAPLPFTQAFFSDIYEAYRQRLQRGISWPLGEIFFGLQASMEPRLGLPGLPAHALAPCTMARPASDVPPYSDHLAPDCPSRRGLLSFGWLPLRTGERSPCGQRPLLRLREEHDITLLVLYYESRRAALREASAAALQDRGWAIEEKAGVWALPRGPVDASSLGLAAPARPSDFARSEPREGRPGALREHHAAGDGSPPGILAARCEGDRRSCNGCGGVSGGVLQAARGCEGDMREGAGAAHSPGQESGSGWAMRREICAWAASLPSWDHPVVRGEEVEEAPVSSGPSHGASEATKTEARAEAAGAAGSASPAALAAPAPSTTAVAMAAAEASTSQREPQGREIPRGESPGVDPSKSSGKLPVKGLDGAAPGTAGGSSVSSSDSGQLPIVVEFFGCLDRLGWLRPALGEARPASEKPSLQKLSLRFQSVIYYNPLTRRLHMYAGKDPIRLGIYPFASFSFEGGDVIS